MYENYEKQKQEQKSQQLHATLPKNYLNNSLNNLKNQQEIRWSQLYKSTKSGKSLKAIQVMMQDQIEQQQQIEKQQKKQLLSNLDFFQDKNLKNLQRCKSANNKFCKNDDIPPFNFVFYQHDIKGLSQVWINDKIKQVTQQQEFFNQKKLTMDSIKKEFENLSVSYIFDQLKQIVYEKNQEEKESEKDLDGLFDKNQITWSKLFMEQPNIQKLLISYLNQLQYLLTNEIQNNWKQMKLFFKCKIRKNDEYSKAQGLKDQEELKKKQETEAQVYKKAQQKLREIFVKNEEKRTEKHKLNFVNNHFQKEQSFEQIHLNTQRRGSFSENRFNLYHSQKDCFRYLNDIPQVVLNSYSPRMMPRLKTQIKADNRIYYRVKAILNNFKLDFNEKMFALQAIYDEEQKKDAEERQKLKIKEGLDNLQFQIKNIENAQFELESNFQIFDSQSQHITIRRKVPMQKLQKELLDWEEQLNSLSKSDVDMAKVVQKIWQIREDFEQELRDEEKGWQIERKSIILHAKIKQDLMRKQYLFVIQALETALNESKIKLQSEVARSQMQVADLEAQYFNMDLSNKHKNIEKFIQEEKQKLQELGLNFLQNENHKQLIKQKQIIENINRYFDYISNFEVTKIQLQKKIESEHQRAEMANQLIDFSHQVSVIYHDVVHFILQNFTSICKQFSILNTEQIDLITEQLCPSELKLTLTLNQLDNFITTFKNMDLDSKITKRVKNYQEHGTILKKIQTIVDLMEQSVIQINSQNNLKNQEDQQKNDNSWSFVALIGWCKQLRNLSQNLQNNLSVNPINVTGQSQLVQNNITELQPVLKNQFKGNLLRSKTKLPRKQLKSKKKDAILSESNKQDLLILNPQIDQLKSQNRLNYKSEQIEKIVKSTSKRKILYQYDQLQNTKIQKKTNQKFFNNIKQNGLAQQFIQYQKQDIDSSLSEDSDDIETQQQNVLKQLQTVLYNKIINEEDNFQFTIQKINAKLEYVFNQIQNYQFRKRHQTVAGNLLPEIVNSVNYGQHKIMPIDCIIIEPYGPPQINFVPLKLLMLQGRGEEASSLLIECLKQFINFFNINHIREFLTNVEYKKLNLKQNIESNVEVQCEILQNPNHIYYQLMRDVFVDVINKMIIDKSGKEELTKFLLLVKTSFEIAFTEEDFLKELNKNFMIKIKKVYKKQKNISFKHQSKIFHFASILNDIKLQLGPEKYRKLDIDQEQISISEISNDSFLENVSIDSKSTIAIENSSKELLAKFKTFDAKINQKLEPKQMIDNSCQTQNNMSYQQYHMLKLKKTNELLGDSNLNQSLQKDKDETIQPKQKIQVNIPSIKNLNKKQQYQIEQKKRIDLSNQNILINYKFQIDSLLNQINILETKLQSQPQERKQHQLKLTMDCDKKQEIINSQFPTQIQTQNVSKQLTPSSATMNIIDYPTISSQVTVEPSLFKPKYSIQKTYSNYFCFRILLGLPVPSIRRLYKSLNLQVVDKLQAKSVKMQPQRPKTQQNFKNQNCDLSNDGSKADVHLKNILQLAQHYKKERPKTSMKRNNLYHTTNNLFDKSLKTDTSSSLLNKSLNRNSSNKLQMQLTSEANTHYLQNSFIGEDEKMKRLIPMKNFEKQQKKVLQSYTKVFAKARYHE